MNELWLLVLSPIGQQMGVLACPLFILGDTLLNRLTLPRLGTHRPPTDWPKVVVLAQIAEDMLYPLVVLASLLLAFHSLGQQITHRATWKGCRGA